jgi:hypothetical protein
VAAAAAERERLERALRQTDARARKLAADLTLVQREQADLQARLDLLARLSDGADSDARPRLRAVPSHPQPRAESTVVRGAAIRTTAVRVLAERRPNQHVHYTEWYRLLLEAGYRIETGDPLATFLTQISRSPVVRRAGKGMYEIDHGASGRIRQRLATLREQLVASTSTAADDVGEAHTRRQKLLAELAQTERRLAEALALTSARPS